MAKDRYLVIEARFRPSLGGWQARVHGYSPTRGKVEEIYAANTFDRWPAAIRVGSQIADRMAGDKSLYPVYRPQIDSRIPPFAERQRAVEFFAERDKERAS